VHANPHTWARGMEAARLRVAGQSQLPDGSCSSGCFRHADVMLERDGAVNTWTTWWGSPQGVNATDEGAIGESGRHRHDVTARSPAGSYSRRARSSASVLTVHSPADLPAQQ